MEAYTYETNGGEGHGDERRPVDARGEGGTTSRLSSDR